MAVKTASEMALPFFMVCSFRFDDICNQQGMVSGWPFGKISVINHTPPFHQFLPAFNTTL